MYVRTYVLTYVYVYDKKIFRWPFLLHIGFGLCCLLYCGPLTPPPWIVAAMRRNMSTASSAGEERRNDFAYYSCSTSIRMKRERRKENTWRVIRSSTTHPPQRQSTLFASSTSLVVVAAAMWKVLVILTVAGTLLEQGPGSVLAFSSTGSGLSSSSSSRFIQVGGKGTTPAPLDLDPPPLYHSSYMWNPSPLTTTSSRSSSIAGTRRLSAASRTRLHMFMGSDGGLLGVGGPEIVS